MRFSIYLYVTKLTLLPRKNITKNAQTRQTQDLRKEELIF